MKQSSSIISLWKIVSGGLVLLFTECVPGANNFIEEPSSSDLNQSYLNLLKGLDNFGESISTDNKLEKDRLSQLEDELKYTSNGIEEIEKSKLAGGARKQYIESLEVLYKIRANREEAIFLEQLFRKVTLESQKDGLSSGEYFRLSKELEDLSVKIKKNDFEHHSIFSTTTSS